MDVAGVDRSARAARQLRRIERQLLEQPFQHRMQAPRADILRARIHLRRDLRQRRHPILGETDLHALGLQQRDVLAGQRSSRARSGCARSRRCSERSSSTRIGKRPCSSGIRSDGLEIWKAPAAMNRTWSVLTGAVLGVDRRALDDRQQVALHALARDVGRRARSRAGDLVDLVDEDDARLLGADAPPRARPSPCRSACAASSPSGAPAPRAPSPCACCVFLGMTLTNSSFRLSAHLLPCPAARRPRHSVAAVGVTSSSTSRSSSLPARSSLRSFSRVAPCESVVAAPDRPSAVIASGRRPCVGAAAGAGRAALLGRLARLDRDRRAPRRAPA